MLDLPQKLSETKQAIEALKLLSHEIPDEAYEIQECMERAIAAESRLAAAARVIEGAKKVLEQLKPYPDGPLCGGAESYDTRIALSTIEQWETAYKYTPQYPTETVTKALQRIRELAREAQTREEQFAALNAWADTAVAAMVDATVAESPEEQQAANTALRTAIAERPKGTPCWRDAARAAITAYRESCGVVAVPDVVPTTLTPEKVEELAKVALNKFIGYQVPWEGNQYKKNWRDAVTAVHARLVGKEGVSNG